MAQGVEQVAVTGLSLGGYVAALSAEVDDRLALSIPNAPVVSMGPLIRQWFPANLLVAGGAQLAGVGREEFDQALAVHSPLTYEPRIAPERRMIIGGLADRLAPPEQSRMLWEHWGHCRLHWFPGNHVLHSTAASTSRRCWRSCAAWDSARDRQPTSWMTQTAALTACHAAIVPGTGSVRERGR